MAGDVGQGSSYADFFQRRVVQSAQHWQKFVAEHQADTFALEHNRVQILRAISFAISSETAWPAARSLIGSFAPFMERRGYWDAWNDILTQAVEAAQQFKDSGGQVTLLALLARLRQRQSLYQEVARLYRQVIRLARQTGNRFEEARACTNLGYLYIDGINRWWRSEVLCCYALKIFEELGSNHGRAHTHNHLGVLYTRQGYWSQAEQHLNQACHLWQQMDDNRSLIIGYENLGMLYYEMERPQEALGCLDKAHQKAELTGEEAELGTIWNNMGFAYRQKDDLARAEFYAKQAEEIHHRFSNLLGLAQVWNNLGLVYLGQRKGAEAKQYLERSLSAYRHLKNWDGETKALTSRIEYELIREDQEQALLYLEQLEQLITQHTEDKRGAYLKEEVKKYRRSLIRLGESSYEH
jgi:tetratricopeptide (TPR) repeat protein